jgi:uncharacterized membrane protein YgcG
MKKYFLPIMTASLLLGGCSAAYKTGQTPDDVYYSSNPVVEAEIARDQRAANSGATDEASYKSYWDNDDAYLRMKVRNGGKWSSIDDQDYWYGYNGGCQCNSNWGYYNSFNSFSSPLGYNMYAYGSYSPWNTYNPWGLNNWYSSGYYSPVIIVGNKYPVYSNSSRPRLTGYGNNVYDRGNSTHRSSTQQTRQYQSIFGSGNSRSSNSSSYDTPNRTFNNSGSGNSSSGSGSSGGSSRSSSGSSSGSGRGGRGG